MRFSTIVFVTLGAAALATGGCATSASRGEWVGGGGRGSWTDAAARGDRQDEKKPEKAEKKDDAEESSGRSVGHVLALYIPNRILDVFDVARAGVDVGPGVGLDVGITEFARVGVMTRTSAGLGLQTLRHLPVKAAAESYVGAGPIDVGAALGPTWYRNVWDVRVELHLLIVGAHVALNVGEVVDAILGFTTLDVMDDDF